MAVTATGPLGSLAPVPMAGLSRVSVHPDHRRRGVLRAMITHHFAQLHEQGAALSGLHAAEVQIYDNFGYGIGSVELLLKLERGAVFNAPNLYAAASKVTTRLIDRCERPRGRRSPPVVARRPAGGRRQELRLLVAATGRRGHGPRGARLLRRLRRGSGGRGPRLLVERGHLTADSRRDGVASCVPTSDEAGPRLPVQSLGAAYLGSRSIAAQAHEGLATELKAGAVRSRSRAMSCDREPVRSIEFSRGSQA